MQTHFTLLHGNALIKGQLIWRIVPKDIGSSNRRWSIDGRWIPCKLIKLRPTDQCFFICFPAIAWQAKIRTSDDEVYPISC